MQLLSLKDFIDVPPVTVKDQIDVILFVFAKLRNGGQVIGFIHSLEQLLRVDFYMQPSGHCFLIEIP